MFVGKQLLLFEVLSVADFRFSVMPSTRPVPHFSSLGGLAISVSFAVASVYCTSFCLLVLEISF